MLCLCVFSSCKTDNYTDADIVAEETGSLSDLDSNKTENQTNNILDSSEYSVDQSKTELQSSKDNFDKLLEKDIVFKDYSADGDITYIKEEDQGIKINENNTNFYWTATVLFTEKNNCWFEFALISELESILGDEFKEFYFVHRDSRYIYYSDDNNLYMIFNAGGQSGSLNGYIVKFNLITNEIVDAAQTYIKSDYGVINCKLEDNILFIESGSQISNHTGNTRVNLDDFSIAYE